jgi:hypothetical protein
MVDPRAEGLRLGRAYRYEQIFGEVVCRLGGGPDKQYETLRGAIGLDD